MKLFNLFGGQQDDNVGSFRQQAFNLSLKTSANVISQSTMELNQLKLISKVFSGQGYLLSFTFHQNTLVVNIMNRGGWTIKLLRHNRGSKLSTTLIKDLDEVSKDQFKDACDSYESVFNQYFKLLTE